jgi:hypothetical protein
VVDASNAGNVFNDVDDYVIDGDNDVLHGDHDNLSSDNDDPDVDVLDDVLEDVVGDVLDDAVKDVNNVLEVGSQDNSTIQVVSNKPIDHPRIISVPNIVRYQSEIPRPDAGPTQSTVAETSPELPMDIEKIIEEEIRQLAQEETDPATSSTSKPSLPKPSTLASKSSKSSASVSKSSRSVSKSSASASKSSKLTEKNDPYRTDKHTRKPKTDTELPFLGVDPNDKVTKVYKLKNAEASKKDASVSSKNGRQHEKIRVNAETLVPSTSEEDKPRPLSEVLKEICSTPISTKDRRSHVSKTNKKKSEKKEHGEKKKSTSKSSSGELHSSSEKSSDSVDQNLVGIFLSAILKQKSMLDWCEIEAERSVLNFDNHESVHFFLLRNGL